MNHASSSDLFRLRRDGQRPLCFSGRLIARHDGQAPAAVWHDLAIYRTTTPGYAVEIVAWLAPESAAVQVRRVRCHAAMFETLNDTMKLLEDYDPSRDLYPGRPTLMVNSTDPTLSPAMLAIQAATLQAVSRDIVCRYKIGVGLLLNDVSFR